MFGRSKSTKPDPGALKAEDTSPSMETDRTLTDLTKPQIKRATRTRLCWTLVASFLLVLTIIFLILVEIGLTNKNDKTLDSIYFIKIDLSNIVPTSVPNSVIINSIAETIGLHDFYTVGLWNFCEGYNDQGTTNCSKPKTLYWFNPVEVLLNELLAGATITLPSDLTSILGLLKDVSQWEFALFLTGACLTFVMIFLQPVSVFSRWWAFLIMIFTFLNALFVTVATVIATVVWIIVKDAATSVTELNIGASIGTKMFAFMWIAAATSILAFIIQLCLCCCCASRRDVKTGRKTGNKKAYTDDSLVHDVDEKPKKKSLFGRKKKEEAAAEGETI